MAISGDLRVSATLASYSKHPPRLCSLPPSNSKNLRLYDVDSCLLRLEAPAPSQAALLNCCSQSESVAFMAVSNGYITRFVLVLVGTQKPSFSCVRWFHYKFSRYDLYSGTIDAIGNHQDMASCVGYSIETCHVISAGLDKKVMSWDTRLANPLALFRNLGAEIDSISISGFDLIVAVGAAVSIYDLCGTMKERWI